MQAVLQTLAFDLRYAVRSLQRSPGFTAIAVFCLALGVGANTAVFSVFSTILLRPLPYHDPDRLGAIYATNPKANIGRFTVAPPDFLDWREQLRALASVGAYIGWTPNLTGVDQPEQLSGMRASGTLFSTLGVEPLAGRALTMDDEQQRARVVVVSHGVWTRLFGADPTFVGRTLRLNGEGYTVVGIMPEAFAFPSRDTELWAPLTLDQSRSDRGEHSLQVVARLAPQVTWDQARAELDNLMTRSARDHVENLNWGASLVPLRDSYVGASARRTLWILLGAVALVLLIACANVANLLLARGSARAQELAIRAAIGASRGRLITQLLTESVVLAVLGGGLGMLLSLWTRDMLMVLLPVGSVARLSPTTIDWRVLLYSLTVSVASVVVYAMLPAFRASGAMLGPSQTSARIAPLRLRGALLVAQTALAVILLAGAGLLVRSFVRLWQTDPGFSAARVLSARISLPGRRDEAAYASFYQQVLAQIAARANASPSNASPSSGAAASNSSSASSAGVVTNIPLGGGGSGGFITFEGRPAPPPGSPEQPGAARLIVSPGYFQALRIPVHEGRLFTDQDSAGAPTVVIVNRALARRYWGNESPIGRRIKRGTPQAKFPWLTIVGVVGDVKQQRLERPDEPMIYLPYLQNPVASMTLVVRSEANASAVAAQVRTAVRAVDRDQPVGDIKMLDEIVLDSLAARWVPLMWMGMFAALALTLAVVGVYGVVSYAVARRRREFGIRVALGAERRDLVRLAIGQGLWPALMGAGVGLVAAMGLTTLIRHLLYEIAPRDLPTLVLSAAVLLAAALAASYPPARRISRQDPTVALRDE